MARVAIHDRIAHVHELSGRYHLSEEIRHVFMRANVGHEELTVLYLFADEEVTSFDVLHLIVVFRVVRGVDRSLVVATEPKRLIGLVQPELR